jgi:DNA adenine methylase
VRRLTRPALRYHGAKWMLAPWILSHFPRHRVYVEPFGGSASVLLRKDRVHADIYNDLDGDLVTYFRILRDPIKAAQLIEAIRLTPFARDEFEEAYEPTDCDLERCRRMVIRSFMGFGSDGTNLLVKTGFRGNSNRSHTTPAGDWRNLPPALEVVTERLRGVVIENRSAAEVMRTHDKPKTLHYVDPPYLPETRSAATYRAGHGYRHELTTEDHEELLELLLDLEGMVVLSGYPADLYDDRLTGWRVVDKETYADGARPRTERIWINASCASALDAEGIGEQLRIPEVIK